MSSEFDDLRESGAANVVADTADTTSAAKQEKADEYKMPVTQDDLDNCKFPQKIWVPVRIESATHGLGKESRQPVVNWRIVATQEPHIGQSIFYSTSLQKHALFSLNNLLEACRFKVFDGWTPKDLYDTEFEVMGEMKDVKGRPMFNVTAMRPKALA